MKRKFIHYSLALLIALFAIPMSGMPQMKKEKKSTHVCPSKVCKHDKKPHVCKINEQHEAFWKANPEAHKAFLLEQEAQRRLVKRLKMNSQSQLKAAERKQKYIIPVVFHVFGKTQSGKSVTYELLEDALRRTNEDFAQKSVGQDQIHPRFQAVLDNLSVEFRLAKKEPNGNICNGVNFYPEKSGFGGINSNAEIQEYAWDNTKYMNVYIMNDLYDDGELYNSGVSWYPTQWMTDENLARVVFNGAYIGDNGDENFRRILTHEFGHFFNLIHTFEGGCPEVNGGDECADTPAATRSQMGVDELNCNNEYTNTQNFMNYTDDYEMFTRDQVLRMTAAMEHSSRITLWQPDNLVATGVNDGFEPGMIVMYDGYSFKEAIINDGSISTELHVKLPVGAEFAYSTFVEGTHFKSRNVPEGLSVALRLTDATNAVLSFSGRAVNNEKEHSVSGISIELLQPAFVTPINQLSNVRIDKYKIDFRSVYDTKYLSVDKSVTGIGNWDYIDLSPMQMECYIWHYDQDPEKKFKLDMDNNAVVSYAGTYNIVPLNLGDEISSASSWYTYTVNGEQADIYNNSFTEWRGKRRYIGIQLQHDNDIYNGWMSASISADGDTFTVHDVAYYTKPDAPIRAGQAHEAMLKFDVDTLHENSFNNNGRLGNFITAKLMNSTFNVAENTVLAAGTHYSITGVPAGLTPEIKVLPNDYLQIKFEGYAQSHNKVDLTKVNITFFDNVFNGLQASEIRNAVNSEITIKYLDEYNVVYQDIDDLTVSKDNDWESFILGSSENSFGAWYHEGNLRFESYESEVVGHVGMLDAKMLAKGSSIDSNAEVWVTPGAFPDEMYITDTNHKEWIGNEGYLGCVVNLNGNRCYAWIRIEVDAAGQSYTVKDWAYNEQPNAPIIAGETIKFTQVSLGISEATFVEPYDNDGSVGGTANITIINDEFALEAGSVLTQGTDFSVANLPEGLTCELVVLDYNNIKLNLLGNAVSSTKPQSGVVELSFKDPVFANSSAATVENSTLNFEIEFKEPWDIIYTDVEDLTVNEQNTWQPFNIGRANINFGAWWYNTDGEMKLESYENYVLCQPGTINLIPFSEGAIIGNDSNEWYQRKDYPSQPNLVSPNFRDWVGREAYVGFCFYNGPFYHFGWMRIVVAANELSYTVLDFAYNDEPGAPILAGQKIADVVADTEAPTVPSNLTASEITQTSVRLDWNASTDNVAVTLYEIGSEGLIIESSATNSVVVSGLVANTNYTFAVRAKDEAGNVSAESEMLSVTTKPDVDTEAPSVPSNLTASEITQTSVKLDWNASTDNVAVTAYEIESEGLVIESSTTNSVVVSGLVADTNYSFTVKAKDEAGNVSALSTEVTVTTLPIIIGPDYCSMVGDDYSYEWITEVSVGSFTNTSAVDNGYGDFTADMITAESGSSLNLSLTPNSAQYTEHWKVWIDYNGNGNFSDAGEEVFSGSGKGATTGSINIPADATGRTRLRVAMRYNIAPVLCTNPDAGEVEDYTINIEGSQVDTTPPTTPSDLVMTSISQTSISLAWTESTDENGISNYEVLNSGTVVSTDVATSATINNLSANTTYSFTVRAIDPSGNVSNESAVLAVTTLGDVSYCDASGSAGPEHIANVLFEGINNSSVRDDYHDYTAMSANVSQGNTYPITVIIGDYYNGDRATVWFDWNQDGIFNTAEEQFILTSNGAEASGTVIVPSNASLGNTRMRVRVNFYEAGAVPCDYQTYGEVEDYTINVSGSAQNMARTKSSISMDVIPDPETRVKLYPNPVIDLLKIRGDDIKNVKVFNVAGKLVLASNNDGNLLELDMDFSDLQEGLYLVRIEMNNNEVITKKVVK